MNDVWMDADKTPVKNCQHPDHYNAHLSIEHNIAGSWMRQGNQGSPLVQGEEEELCVNFCRKSNRSAKVFGPIGILHTNHSTLNINCFATMMLNFKKSI